MYYASTRPHLNCIRAIAAEGGVDERCDGETALLRLAYAGESDRAPWTDHLDPIGDTYRLASGEYVTGDMAYARRALLESGADPNARHEAPHYHGKTVLMLAAVSPLYRRAEYQECALKELIAAGADVRARSYTGATALHYACTNVPHAELVVKILLDAGADVNATDNRGATPLTCACYLEFAPRATVLNILVDAGANVDCYDTASRPGPYHNTDDQCPLRGLVCESRGLDYVAPLVFAGACLRSCDDRFIRATTPRCERAIRERKPVFHFLRTARMIYVVYALAVVLINGASHRRVLGYYNVTRIVVATLAPLARCPLPSTLVLETVVRLASNGTLPGTTARGGGGGGGDIHWSTLMRKVVINTALQAEMLQARVDCGEGIDHTTRP